MVDLKTPLREHLEDGFDEADLHRNWRGVQRQLARREVSSNRHALWAIAFGGAICALASILWLTFASPRPISPGPLQLAATAGPLPTALAGSPEIIATELSDGSRVTLTPESHLEVLENSGNSFVTALRRGRSTFNVKPGGSRRWVIECGLATVEVVGTAFSIEREAGKVGITVEHGTVIVRGDHVPGREQRLEAGQHLELVEESAAVNPAVPMESPMPTPTAMPMPMPMPMPTPTPTPTPILTPDTQAPTPIPSPAPALDPVDTMLREADRAQRAGDRRHAAAILQRVITDAHDDPRAAFAAFTLARLTMDDDPRASADALASLLKAGIPRGLEEDARARLVEAYARAGDSERAQAAAAEYDRRFPNGSRAPEVRRWAHP